MFYSIGIYESFPSRIVIPASQIVQPRLFVEHIPPIPEWISLAQRISQRAGGTQRLAPCIVRVFYHKVSVTVKDTDDIALQIAEDRCTRCR